MSYLVTLLIWWLQVTARDKHSVISQASAPPNTFSHLSCLLVNAQCSGPALHPLALIGLYVLVFAADCIISKRAKGVFILAIVYPLDCAVNVRLTLCKIHFRNPAAHESLPNLLPEESDGCTCNTPRVKGHTITHADQTQQQTLLRKLCQLVNDSSEWGKDTTIRELTGNECSLLYAQHARMTRGQSDKVTEEEVDIR